MTLTIYALDNEFAAATGTNVNNGAGTSTFDYPPNSSKDLVISSQPGDPSPYIFTPGDTYTLSFGGNGGTTIADAVVIRSDFISYDGDDGWAVVFEGTDPNGDLVQVVWTPEFDLEGWYWNNFEGGNPPGFYTADASATDYTLPCFAPETRLATPDGPRPIADLRPGDLVVTRDHGAQPLRWVGLGEVPGMRRGAPVWFETGVLGNNAPLWVSQQHRMLVRVPEALASQHGAEVLLPARAFLNGATVRLMPRPVMRYMHVLFDHHALVEAEGAACESLFLGPMARRALSRMKGPVLPRSPQRGPMKPARPMPAMAEAERLLQAIRTAEGRAPVLFGRRGRGKSRPFVFKPDAQGRHPASRRAQMLETT